jgi:hypothetical protein
LSFVQSLDSEISRFKVLIASKPSTHLALTTNNHDCGIGFPVALSSQRFEVEDVVKVEEFRNLSILVVDDDPAVLELTAVILREIGVESIRTANNGANALALLQERMEPINVIVTISTCPVWMA